MFYTVKSGDTLGKIARRILGSRRLWPELAQYNHLDNPNRIEVGQVLEIPPWLPRRFRFPLDKTETPYYKFGSTYRSGPHIGFPHPGVDFHEGNGARVYAIGEGRVIKVGHDRRGYGHYTMIEHRPGPVWSLYAHLSARPLYKEGQVLEGENIFIGWEGDSGASGDILHLHLEIKKTVKLGLYPYLTVDNLPRLYHDPYVFLSSARRLFLPVHCWECPRCN